MAENQTQYMATWGHKGFLVSPDKVVPLMGLATDHGLKSEYHTDTSGPEPINVRGRAPQSVTLKTRYLAAAGLFPKNQMRQWWNSLGKTYPLYLGGKRFGPPLMQLAKVDCDNFLFSHNGDIIGVDITVAFNEYTGEKKEVSQKTFNAWVEADKKKAALWSGASAEDKKEKK